MTEVKLVKGDAQGCFTLTTVPNIFINIHEQSKLLRTPVNIRQPSKPPTLSTTPVSNIK